MIVYTIRLSVAIGICWNRKINEFLFFSCKNAKSRENFLLAALMT